MTVKAISVGLQSFLVFLSTVAVVLAEEAQKEATTSGYQALYYVWYFLIAVILIWGVYDSFFRPID